MDIHVERHPQDPCARIIVKGTEAELESLDLLYQGIMTNRHKEGRFVASDTFTVFFQLEPPIN